MRHRMTVACFRKGPTHVTPQPPLPLHVSTLVVTQMLSGHLDHQGAAMWRIGMANVFSPKTLVFVWTSEIEPFMIRTIDSHRITHPWKEEVFVNGEKHHTASCNTLNYNQWESLRFSANSLNSSNEKNQWFYFYPFPSFIALEWWFSFLPKATVSWVILSACEKQNGKFNSFKRILF